MIDESGQTKVLDCEVLNAIRSPCFVKFSEQK
jgi:hypothetical protein